MDDDTEHEGALKRPNRHWNKFIGEKMLSFLPARLQLEHQGRWTMFDIESGEGVFADTSTDALINFCGDFGLDRETYLCQLPILLQ